MFHIAIIIIIIVFIILYNQIEHLTVLSDDAVQNISDLYFSYPLITKQLQIDNGDYRTEIYESGKIVVSNNNDKKFTLNEYGDIIYPDRRQWKTLAGRQLPDGMINGTPVSANSNKTCEILCDGDPFCIGYSYDHKKLECVTKYLPPANKEANSLAGLTQYKNGVRNGFLQFHDKKLFNENATNTDTFTANLNNCEKTCLDEPDCIGYTFVQGKKCEHHSFITNDNITTGIKTI